MQLLACQTSFSKHTIGILINCSDDKCFYPPYIVTTRQQRAGSICHWYTLPSRLMAQWSAGGAQHFSDLLSAFPNRSHTLPSSHLQGIIHGTTTGLGYFSKGKKGCKPRAFPSAAGAQAAGDECNGMAKGPRAPKGRDCAFESKGRESGTDKVDKRKLFFLTLCLIRLPQENAQAKI